MEQNLEVKLFSMSENSIDNTIEDTVASAAKLCYDKDFSIGKTVHDTDTDTNRKLIRRLKLMNHLSPFEHVSFTFYVSGISRACSHQLVRHRIASYTQRSQRYINETHFDYIIPPSIKKNEEATIEFKRLMNDIVDAYGRFKTKYQIPNEDARFILPNACETKIFVTMNVRELFHFFNQRCCNMAQWEIREMAIQMLKICKNESREIFYDAGPSCLNEDCKEGTRSCGKQYDVQEFFLNL
jgi:thymidylate synthase (FAD)